MTLAFPIRVVITENYNVFPSQRFAVIVPPFFSTTGIGRRGKSERGETFALLLPFGYADGLRFDDCGQIVKNAPNPFDSPFSIRLPLPKILRLKSAHLE